MSNPKLPFSQKEVQKSFAADPQTFSGAGTLTVPDGFAYCIVGVKADADLVVTVDGKEIINNPAANFSTGLIYPVAAYTSIVVAGTAPVVSYALMPVLKKADNIGPHTMP